MAKRTVCLILTLIWTISSETVDWTTQCNRCKCVWSNGKRTADCSNISLTEIPTDLSSDIREIDFSNNLIYGLNRQVLMNAHLRDIHKLKFQNCSLELIDKASFAGLLLLIELDLARNEIAALDPLTFRDNSKLRVLSLSHNKLQRLETHLFHNLTHLQRISLDHNRIELLMADVFVLLPSLQHINLGNNRLKQITDFTTHLPKLNSLNLEANRWICDCHLQAFRNKTIKENLITTPTECAAPAPLRGSLWGDADVVFACLPQIVEPAASTLIAAASNVTLTCRVLGQPPPDVVWYSSNGKLIEEDARQQRYKINRNHVGDYTYNNLTILNVNYRDKGEYKCMAKNPGGSDERNVSLVVTNAGGDGGSMIIASPIPLIIGLSVGSVVVMVVLLLVVCCCCKRSTHGMSSKRGDLMQTSSEECIRLHHGQAEMMEKALITDVNPVMKPPRVCSVPPSIHSGGTEVSEVKRNLLDNDSVFAGDDELRSLDYDYPYRKSGALLDAHHYPPDLLPFPARLCQVSPAGSSASTVADTTRLPAHHGPQSPIQSPIYETMSLYRTLPHSRSQSPFVGVPARVPRQGYVTIPRRPRQSWSSEPPPLALSDVGEPLYDNLGLRTTVDGSSALSLNKLGGGSEAGTPKSARMFALSPTSCDPIAESHEGHRLSPSRTEWAKANAEAFKSPEPKSLKKVAPIPPPKPKKRASTGPLFEDEGEDGTEV